MSFYAIHGTFAATKVEDHGRRRHRHRGSRRQLLRSPGPTIPCYRTIAVQSFHADTHGLGVQIDRLEVRPLSVIWKFESGGCRSAPKIAIS